MNWLDIVIIIVLACSIAAGFKGGFARVTVGFVASVLGILFGFWFYGMAAEHVADYVNSRPMANLLGFLLIFGAFVLAGALLGRALAALFKWVGLSWLDRLLGAAFGFVRGAVMTVAVVTVILAFAPQPPPRSLVESKTLPYVIDTSSVLAAITPHEVKEAFRETKDKVKKIWSDTVNKGKELKRQEA
ncbi:MAG TPA: CvpA family protein [Bryobacteraceae bacterium]|nr:CvpA family protein [Bryobacteraceae bacterium]